MRNKINIQSLVIFRLDDDDDDDDDGDDFITKLRETIRADYSTVLRSDFGWSKL